MHHSLVPLAAREDELPRPRSYPVAMGKNLGASYAAMEKNLGVCCSLIFLHGYEMKSGCARSRGKE